MILVTQHPGHDERAPTIADGLLPTTIDPDTGEILASALTGAEDGDASMVGPPLDQIAAPIAAFIADGAYEGDPFYRADAEWASGAVVIVPPASRYFPAVVKRRPVR